MKEINSLKVQISALEEKYVLMEESLQFHTEKFDDLFSQHQSFSKYFSEITKDKNDAKAEISLAKSQINNLKK